MPRIHELLTYTKESKASDLHLAAGLEPRVRRHGKLEPVPEWSRLSDEELLALLGEIARPEQWESYLAGGDLDFAYSLPGVARFRANYLRQENGSGAVFRTIPERILTAEELGLPPAVTALADLNEGLVLVTGPTGSGKSTTLAAVIDRINRTHRKHVVTIEDPVEFVHENRGCVFSQREVGHDTESFGSALRAAIRQDAQVILVGEMRDLETISLAITAAEMGSLVFGTLHTNSAVKTIDRLIDAFPVGEQPRIRTTLGESLAAIVAQLLLPTADGMGRVAAIEIMLRTKGLPNIIREGNTTLLMSLIQGGKALGMQSMDDALMALVQSKRVAIEEALFRATEKGRFEALLEQQKREAEDPFERVEGEAGGAPA